MGESPADAVAQREALALYQNGEFAQARRRYAEICKADPDDHESLWMVGLCHMGSGNVQEAIAAFRHVIEKKPDFAPAYARLGKACMGQMAFEEAADCFRKALDIEPGNPVSLNTLGEALIALGRFDEAVEHIRRAFRFFPTAAKLHAQLAFALERTHRLEEARAAAERTLEIDPGNPRAQLILAIMARRQGDLAEARERLGRVQAGTLAPQQRAAVAAELGRVLEGLGDYAAAFRAFASGNRAMEDAVQRSGIDSRAIIRTIKRNRAWFTADSTKDWLAQEPDDGHPSPIFLVGFPRSGTTLTEQILASLDRVAATDEQTLLYRLIHDLGNMFGRPVTYPGGLNDLSESELSWLRLHYWHLVEEMVGPLEEGQYLLDKLPLNLIELGLVYRLFPRARVVVVLRDPRDSCLSCYAHSFVLNQAMVNFLDLQRTAKLYVATMDLWLHYRSFIQLPFMEIRYEDLVADMESWSRRLVEFVGLEWDDKVLKFYDHARERGVKTPSYSVVTSPIYQQAVGRWLHYREELRPILPILQPFIETFGYGEAPAAG